MAFVVDGAMPWHDEQLLEHLAQVLPFYMVPSLILRLPALLKPQWQGGSQRVCWPTWLSMWPTPQVPLGEAAIEPALSVGDAPAESTAPLAVSEQQIVQILRRELLLPSLSLDDNQSPWG